MQDFSKKITMVLREDLASWQLTNTVGHITAYLGNKMKEPFDTGDTFTSKDGVKFPRNSQFAIVALRASRMELKTLFTALQSRNLSWIAYVQEMIDMIDDAELEKQLKTIPADSLDILGIGMFGHKDELKELTTSLKLWK